MQESVWPAALLMTLPAIASGLLYQSCEVGLRLVSVERQ